MTGDEAMRIETAIVEMAKAAKEAAVKMARCPAVKKNEALLKIADRIRLEAFRIKAENAKDLVYAKEAGLSAAMIDRLTVKDSTISSMADGLKEVARLSDPVGSVTRSWLRPNGLEVSRMRIPLGVIGIIYESRPNVTIDAAGLCLKSGNAVILRGGSEALHSNRALAAVIEAVLGECGLPEKAVQVVPTRDREAVQVLLRQEDTIDLIIPRGGESLIRFVVENSKIPVLKHYKVSSRKIRVVHWGIDDDIADYHLNYRSPLNETHKTVLFLGRVTRQKGPNYFVEVARKVLKFVPDALFIIAGDGDQLPGVIHRAHELGIGDKVLFTGFLKGEIGRASCRERV